MEYLLQACLAASEMAPNRTGTDAEQGGDRLGGEVFPVGEDDDGSLTNAQAENRGEDFRSDVSVLDAIQLGNQLGP
jgi:hypothetical protein